MDKLNNAPLKEVIFELRWDLETIDGSNSLFDPEFDYAVGKLEEKLECDFPIRKRTIPQLLAASIQSYTIIHQFWSDDEKWPVIQYGPGIFTINDARPEYKWDKNFFPLIKDKLKILNDSYRNRNSYSLASLRYIDIVETKNYAFNNLKKFIHDNFNIEFESTYDKNGKLKDFRFHHVYDLGEDFDFHFTIGSGRNEKNEDIVIWETNMVSNRVIDNYLDAISWVENAHRYSSNVFKDICKDTFYASFK